MFRTTSFLYQIVQELKHRIKEEIAAILKQMTRRVMENRRERLEQCLRNGGGHLNDQNFQTQNVIY
jgi:hypothetical protein